MSQGFKSRSPATTQLRHMCDWFWPALRIHISSETHCVLTKLGGYHAEKRGLVDIKVTTETCLLSFYLTTINDENISLSFTCRWCHLTWTWRQKPLLSIFQPRAKTNFYTHYHLSVFYIKGKGMMETYFLCGKDGFSKPLPDVSLAQSLEAPDCKWSHSGHSCRLQCLAVASLYKIIETVEFALLILLSVSVSIHSLNLYGLSALKWRNHVCAVRSRSQFVTTMTPCTYM